MAPSKTLRRRRPYRRELIGPAHRILKQRLTTRSTCVHGTRTQRAKQCHSCDIVLPKTIADAYKTLLIRGHWSTMKPLMERSLWIMPFVMKLERGGPLLKASLCRRSCKISQLLKIWCNSIRQLIHLITAWSTSAFSYSSANVKSRKKYLSKTSLRSSVPDQSNKLRSSGQKITVPSPSRSTITQ